MKKLLALLLLLTILCQVYSQDYDLIVRSNGDSIACHIDSITETHIYFEIISNKIRIHTYLDKTDIFEYKRNAINKKLFVFKTDRGIIKSPKQLSPDTVSIKDIQKNSVYVGILTVNYSRMVPGDRIGFTIAGGFSFVTTAYGGGIGLIAETTLLVGGTKHFFEPGIMLFSDSDFFLPMIRTGYRYQGSEGLLFRAALLFNYVDAFGYLPAISIGYSF